MNNNTCNRRVLPDSIMIAKGLINLPLLEFKGSVLVHSNENAINEACDKIKTLCENKKIVVGFDCEWDVNWCPATRKGNHGKTALIQICLNENECHFFHLAQIDYRMTNKLRDLITNSNLLKAGINIDSDIYKLHKDYDVLSDLIVSGKTKSTIDLSLLANKIFRKRESWSLDGLTKYLLNRRLEKVQSVRLSKWSQTPLSNEQIQYAACDAYVSPLLLNT
ncbi:Werner syndrome ATP-dependent helicase-like isoform X2, partial [Dinothrombium tinctorium]